MSDFDSIDFFRGNELVVDPYPYFDHLRARCPVVREPHHGVVMVTGYDEALQGLHGYGHVLLVQFGDRPVPRLSRAARGGRRQRPHRAAP